MLYNIIISPIENLLETVFYFTINFLSSFGIIGAIFAVSLVMNFLALPLYNIADAIQENERNIQKRLAYRTGRIKQAFKGDEQFMMLSAYYRQNGYHPLYSLRASLSILIEIPFFIAAYHFLSHCPTLSGSSFWIFKDLANPDALLKLPFAIGGNPVTVNVLPITMTLINVVSAAVYLKGSLMREKIQTFGLALIFLVLLYNSPAGLVIYWILNNLFSLAKNIVNRYVKNPVRLVHGIISAILLAAGFYLVLKKQNLNIVKRLMVMGFAIVITLVPFIKRILQKFFGRNDPFSKTSDADFPLFIYSALGLTILLGILLPANIIATSPVEFSFIGDSESPLTYIWSSFFLCTGLFIFWPVAIWKMFGGKVRIMLPVIFGTLFFCAIANAFVFRYDYGHLSIFFQLDDSGTIRNASPFFTVLPLVFMTAVFVLLLIWRNVRFSKLISGFMMAICLAELAFSGIKMASISKDFTLLKENRAVQLAESEALENGKIEPLYHFSKDGKNVIVFFLDRAVGSFLPYIVKQFPELEETYSGFVYYPNTVSFGNTTWCGSPAMMGGYEYTNIRKQEREPELNEEIHVLADVFNAADYEVTVSDPPEGTVNFEELSKEKDINSFVLFERFNGKYISEHPEAAEQNPDATTKKRISRFVIMEALYPLFRFTFYNQGSYFSESVIPVLDHKFLGYFSSLYYMDQLTASDGKKNAYMFIGNDTTHEYSVLREPDFMPDMTVDVSKATAGFYDFKIPFYADNANDLAAYHVNAAAVLQIGKWLNRLKELGVYDNSRIIIVSDHGSSIPAPGFDGTRSPKFYSKFNPVLIYKDFEASGNLASSNEFMTNADTVTLAVSDLDVPQVNPFTGKAFSETVSKTPAHIYAAVSLDEFRNEFASDENLSGGAGAPSTVPTYYVKENIFEPENWTPVWE